MYCGFSQLMQKYLNVATLNKISFLLMRDSWTLWCIERHMSSYTEVINFRKNGLFRSTLYLP